MFDFYDEEARTIDIKNRFEQQQGKTLPAKTEYSHGKEYHFVHRWSGDGQKIINYKLDFYDGRLYYLDQGYLFSSNQDGTDIKILLKVSEYFKTDVAVNVNASNVFIAVNQTGVYLYQHDRELLVACFTLDGNYIQNHAIAGDTSLVYIAGKHLYYVRTTQNETRQQVYLIDLETGVKQILFTATKILELYGDAQKVALKATFEARFGEHDIEDTGWYLYTFSDATARCLSCDSCPPHLVFDRPEAYIEGTSSYIEFKDRVQIRMVDLVRNMMWIATPLQEKLKNGMTSYEYWEAYALEVEGTVVADAPIWRLTTSQFSAGSRGKLVNQASYFNGSCFLNGRSLYQMKSYQVDGTSIQYGKSKTRGACNNFRVLGGYVYADFDGNGWEQYQLDQTKLTFVRACQFGTTTAVTADVKALIKAFNRR